MKHIPDFMQPEASTEQLLHPAGERRRTPQDSSPRSRRNLFNFVRTVLLQNMYPLLNQALRTRNCRNNPIFCTPHATPRHRTRECRTCVQSRARHCAKVAQHLPKNSTVVVVCTVCVHSTPIPFQATRSMESDSIAHSGATVLTMSTRG